MADAVVEDPDLPSQSDGASELPSEICPDLAPGNVWPDPVDWAGWEDLYGQSSCHVFAMAVRELWPDLEPGTGQETGPAFTVLCDPYEASWEDPDDPEAALPKVVHVYAVVTGESGPLAVDIFGVRPLHLCEDECASRFSPGILEARDAWDAGELSALIEGRVPDHPGTGHFPLHAVDRGMIDRAKSVALRMFYDGPAAHHLRVFPTPSELPAGLPDPVDTLFDPPTPFDT